MIQFKNVSKKYSKGIDALNDVSFTIEDGEFVFLIGPSGAGKTTIIKLLLKEEDPTSGKVILNGQDISYLRARRIPAIRRNIGVVFQNFRLLEDRNVYKNVKFALDILGVSKKESKKSIKRVLDLVNLSHREKSYPLQLSGGEQQRVSMARAMVNNPKILIADEPTGNLDPETSWEIMDSLLKINESGTTVIMVTHSKEIVDKLRKRVIHLENGSIVSDEMEGTYR
ncbi:cell division ATP-binding protein FtsE [Microaceticoccus formicicus]|uniref:cell division ATP-binding protein FtsE n=1 Tax=Microaceticoccus formicicus TaxID=3118105 RepID=UPI003CD01DC1|nr:cell division ATP-binding protein FtsE [Peptoniphilaceae bacterium AMB_02]